MKSKLEPRIDRDIHSRLDLLRGISAILVLIDHSYSAYVVRLIGLEHPLSLFMFFIGYHAVIVFFLLSGYLITESCDNNIKKWGTFNVKQYIKSRIYRIYPPLLLSIAIIITIYGLINYYQLPGSSTIPYGNEYDKFTIRKYFEVSYVEVLNTLAMNGGLVKANGPLWSLYLEVKLYILAMIFFIARSINNYFKKIITIIIFVIFFLLFNFNNPDSFDLTYTLIWGLGMISFYLSKKEPNVYYIKGIRILTVLILVIIIYITASVPRFLDVGNPNNFVRESSKLIFSILYMNLIFFTRLEYKKQQFLKYLSKTATFSYSLYVLHYPILLLGLSLFQGWLGQSVQRSIFLAAVMSITIIYMSYLASLMVEKNRRPMRQLF